MRKGLIVLLMCITILGLAGVASANLAWINSDITECSLYIDDGTCELSGTIHTNDVHVQKIKDTVTYTCAFDFSDSCSLKKSFKENISCLVDSIGYADYASVLFISDGGTLDVDATLKCYFKLNK